MTDTRTTPALNITDVVQDGPIPPRVHERHLAERAAHPDRRGRRAKGPPPWSARIIADERNMVTLIATAPGSGNRPHWHRDFDEWWVVMAGQLEWELTGGTVVKAQKDDIVWVPRGTVHHIRAVGDEMTLRLAVAMPPASHSTTTASSAATTEDGPAEWGM